MEKRKNISDPSRRKKKKTNPLFQQEEAEHYQKNNYKDTVYQTA